MSSLLRRSFASKKKNPSPAFCRSNIGPNEKSSLRHPVAGRLWFEESEAGFSAKEKPACETEGKKKEEKKRKKERGKKW